MRAAAHERRQRHNDDPCRQCKLLYWCLRLSAADEGFQIPWDVPKKSICEALAADDHLALNNAGYPLFHFTMDRAAQKTWDCFVEIKTEEAALALVGELMTHPVRISSRTAIVNIVEPRQLLMCLFPRAKCIVWEGDKPLLISCRPGETPFRGFLMQEELYLISRAAESPQKVCSSPTVH